MQIACTIACLMTMLLGSSALGKTIDGDFSDWNGVRPISQGLLSCVGQATGSGANRIQAVWIDYDSNNLYLSVEFGAAVKGGTWSPAMVAIDTDLNRETGFRSRELGVDYLLQPVQTLNGQVLLHRRMDGADQTTWSKWLPAITLDKAMAIGRGAEANRIEMAIPWKTIGYASEAEASGRFVISDGSALLNPSEGSWAPGFRLAYFSFGKDLRAMDNAKNLCPNGSFEELMEAAARPLPQDWTEVQPGAGRTIGVTTDAVDGKRALLLKSENGSSVGMNSAVMDAGHGLVRFQYKLISSDASGQNFALCVIGMSGSAGLEVTRQSYVPPADHVADGRWHSAQIEFDFSAKGCSRFLIAPRVNEGAPATGAGEWLIDGVEVYAVKIGAQAKLAHIWVDKPVVTPGETIRLSAWIENSGDEDLKAAQIRMDVGTLLVTKDSERTIPLVPAGSFERIDWELTAVKAGEANVSVELGATKSGGSSYRVLVKDSGAKFTRQELCTDQNGFWRVLPRPATLQKGSTQPITRVKHKKSSEIARSPYGICAQLPRSRDYEDPYNPNHLIDGDPDTCWSSQQNPSPYPGRSPWIRVDLGQARMVKQVNLIPYWRNTDFPLGFSILTSLDGKVWQTGVRVKAHNFGNSGQMRGDKFVQEFPLSTPVEARYIRVDFERLPLSGGNYAEVSQGYKARLGGVEIIDAAGTNVSLATHGAKATASDVFTGWQNTAKTVTESFPYLMDIGLKWVRIGQWGDQTEWAAVERQKGVFAIDEATDKAIRKLGKNGVDILFGLQYGNPLYSPKEPWGDIGPAYTEGHPFYRSTGPRTDEERAAFVRYVDYVVRRYKDQIRWWEVWNEENGWFPGHEPALYGKLLAAAAKQVKAVDPTAKVMYGGTAAPAPIGAGIALDQGAAPYVDGYAFHPYGIDKPEGGMGTMESDGDKNLGQSKEQTGWNKLEDVIAGVKEPFVKRGIKDVEIWMDEWGTNVAGQDFTYNPGVGEFGCTKALMRFYVYAGWLNVPTAWWALYNMNKSQDWGILDIEGYGFRPMAYGLQNVCTVLSDVTPVRDFNFEYSGDAPEPKVIGYRRDKDGTTVAAAWAAESYNDEVKSYPSQLTFPAETQPADVVLTDLYWGITQKAQWTYENNRLVIKGVVLHDYPVVVSWH